jgi:hypothetical protein
VRGKLCGSIGQRPLSLDEPIVAIFVRPTERVAGAGTSIRGKEFPIDDHGVQPSLPRLTVIESGIDIYEPLPTDGHADMPARAVDHRELSKISR